MPSIKSKIFSFGNEIKSQCRDRFRLRREFAKFNERKSIFSYHKETFLFIFGPVLTRGIILIVAFLHSYNTHTSFISTFFRQRLPEQFQHFSSKNNPGILVYNSLSSVSLTLSQTNPVFYVSAVQVF